MALASVFVKFTEIVGLQVLMKGGENIFPCTVKMQIFVNLGIRGEDLLLRDHSQSYQTLKDTRKHGGNVT